MEATQVCCIRFMQDIGDDPNIVFSCVEFNETADKPFEAAPPSVAAAKLRQRKGIITPADGTVYMAGWHAAYCVIDRDDEIAAGTRRACVVFLSDGGPGDLVPVPPALGEEARGDAGNICENRRGSKGQP